MGDDIRILHVDDDPAFADVTAEFLEREDERYAVDTVTDPTETLDRLEAVDVDCVVSDYDMPDMDGLGLLTDVREEFPDLPFILFTGKGSEEIASEAISAGVTDYLQKTGKSEQYRVLAIRIRNAVDRYRAEQQLQQEYERFSALFEDFPEPTFAYAYEDDVPVIHAVNDAFVETFGFDAETAVGVPVDDLIVPPEHTEEAAAIDKRVQAGERIDAELVRQTTDGPRHFRLRNIALPADNDLDGFAVYADITERKRREGSLERENERLEEFASLLSHDVRDPLETARGGLELVAAECDSDHLGSVTAALERMDDLIDRTLTLVRDGRVVGETDSVDLCAVAEECWDRAGDPDARLRAEDAPTVEADPDRVRALLENLFRNAVEHGPDSSDPRDSRVAVGDGSPDESGADVTVRVGALASGFFVADDGVGIPAGERDDVLSAGYSSGDRTGLGLAIVTQIAEAHGWRVGVTDSASGGARFEFTGVEMD